MRKIKYQKRVLSNLLSGFYEQVELELKDESHRAIFETLRKEFVKLRKEKNKWFKRAVNN